MTAAGSGAPSEPTPPPTKDVDAWVHFDTNTVGSAVTVNDAIATTRGWTWTSLTAPNGTSGFVMTNGAPPMPWAPLISGTTYWTNSTNAVRYDHVTSPAQYLMGRFPADVADATAAGVFLTTFNGPDGGTYDLFQLQTSDGSGWCSCNYKDNPTPQAVAHTQGSPGAGSPILLTPGIWIRWQVKVSGGTCYLTLYNHETGALIGTSSNAMGTAALIRYWQMGQFGHSAHAGDYTVFDHLVFRDDGADILP